MSWKSAKSGHGVPPAFPDLEDRSAKSVSDFWKILPALILLCAAISWLAIDRLAEHRRSRMLGALHSRAESLIWSVEGSSRFFHRDHQRNLSPMLAEIGQQPGVAWISVINRQGRIIFDSNPALEGQDFYNPQELEQLLPSAELQGRFVADDPDIYETWRVFSPQKKNGEDQLYIFVGLDTARFKPMLKDYERRLASRAILLNLGFLGSLILGFYLWKHHAAQRRLEDALAVAAQIMKSYPAGLVITDNKGKINFYNEHAAQMLRIRARPRPASLQDIPWADWNAILAELGAGKPLFERESSLVFANGEKLPVNLSAAPIADRTGQKTGCLFVLRNLEEISLLREKVAEAQRLSAIGRLASGVAHEIRNPLGAICGYAHYLRQKLQGDELAESSASLLLEEAERLNRSLSDLLGLARPSQLNLKKRPLDKIVEKVYALLKPDAQAREIQFSRSLPQDAAALPLPDIDEDRLVQAVFNLALNAIQAVPPRGKVSIALSFAPQENNFGQAGMWKIEVRDTGPGISEENQKQIFTPYFTTKANGTGLGLAISQQTAESHGGALTVASIPGRGAIFTISIPCAR